MSGREERICDNIGLVHACARRFMGRGIEYDDLFQSVSYTHLDVYKRQAFCLVRRKKTA